jgi:hypothetical protein
VSLKKKKIIGSLDFLHNRNCGSLRKNSLLFVQVCLRVCVGGWVWVRSARALTEPKRFMGLATSQRVFSRFTNALLLFYYCFMLGAGGEGGSRWSLEVRGFLQKCARMCNKSGRNSLMTHTCPNLKRYQMVVCVLNPSISLPLSLSMCVCVCVCVNSVMTHTCPNLNRWQCAET